MRTDLIIPESVAIGWCQLSMTDSVFNLAATTEALGCYVDEFPISKCSIQRI